MSMTKSEFMRRYRDLWLGRFAAGWPPLTEEVVVLAEEAGIEWAPEPTPEPTGDLSMVRVIDAEGDTWRPALATARWARLGHPSIKPWSEIPQPVTVLRPEGSAS